MQKISDISYKPRNILSDVCTLDLYLPDQPKKGLPVFIYFHGGGLENGDKNGIGDTPKYLTDRGFAMASVNYRMYPDCRFPDYLVDCADAVAWVQNFGGKYAELGNVIVGGSSAGGYLSMMLFFNRTFYKNAGAKLDRITGYYFDAGQPTTHFNILKYEKGWDSRLVVIDETAPLYYLREDFLQPEKLPHCFIITSEHDITNRPEQLAMMKVAMLQFGFPEEKLTFKKYMGFGHCGYTGNEEYNKDLADLIEKCK